MVENANSCRICGQHVVPSGQGITLLNYLICEVCEKDIVETPVTDNRYLLIKDKIKEIWFG